MDDKEIEKKSLDVLMEEYKTLRTESLNTIGHRISIMGYSFGTLAIVASVTVSAKVPDLVVAFILGLVVPALAKTVILVWIGEYARSQRAGASIARLEERINAKLCETLLTWESNLRLKNVKIDKPYKNTINLFLTIGSVSELISIPYFYYGIEIDSLASENLRQKIAIHPLHIYDMLPRSFLTIFFAFVIVYIEVIMRIGVRREWEKSNYYATVESIIVGYQDQRSSLMESEFSVASRNFYDFHQRITKICKKLVIFGLRILRSIVSFVLIELWQKKHYPKD